MKTRETIDEVSTTTIVIHEDKKWIDIFIKNHDTYETTEIYLLKEDVVWIWDSLSEMFSVKKG